MKSVHLILVILSSMICLSCLEEIENENVIVLRDCTGTYLRYNRKDYHVCNLEKVESFPDGTLIMATFKRIKRCDGSAKNVIVCMSLHANEGWVEVEKVK
jgi:hypothetical protein